MGTYRLGSWYCSVCWLKITGNEAREKLKVAEARLVFIKTYKPEIHEGADEWYVSWTDEEGTSNEEWGPTFEEALDAARVPEEQVRAVDT